MVSFWDSSAIVPLLVDEPATARIQQAYSANPRMITVWWATVVECQSALGRRRRLAPDQSRLYVAAGERLGSLVASWAEVAPSDQIRELAGRLVRDHDLRAADALQLAAAWEAAEGRPPSLSFVSLDRRLNEAARREGFRVVELGT